MKLRLNEADTEADKRGHVSSERQREKPQVLISQMASLSEAGYLPVLSCLSPRPPVISFNIPLLNKLARASLMASWLRIHLPMQGTWVQALVQEDPTCRGATKPVRHNY